MRAAHARNARGFTEIPKNVMAECPDAAMALDNASHHKSKVVGKFTGNAIGTWG